MIKQKEFSNTYPIFIFQCSAAALLCFPIGSISILWYFGNQQGETFWPILHISVFTAPEFYLLLPAIFIISLVLWFVRLTITKSKMHYSVFGLPISWIIQRHEILNCRINTEYDSPYTYTKRKITRFKDPESEQQFNLRYSTVEFNFLKMNLLNQIRHKFSLIRLSAFSAPQSAQIMDDLKRNWNLKTERQI